MRALPLLWLVGACSSVPAGDKDPDGAPQDTDAPAVVDTDDTDAASPDDTDLTPDAHGLPPVDASCLARFPSDPLPDDELKRLVGDWQGRSAAYGALLLTLAADGTYSWLLDEGDYSARYDLGRWGAVREGAQRLLLLDGVAVVPFHFDGDALVVEDLDAPGQDTLTGGAGSVVVPQVSSFPPPRAWCAATGTDWRPTHPWAEQPLPTSVSFLPDGTSSATWTDGCVATGGAWSVASRPHDRGSPQLGWRVSGCDPRHTSSWTGYLSLTAGWFGHSDSHPSSDALHAWWPASTPAADRVIDGWSYQFRLYGTATPETRAGVPWTQDLTLTLTFPDAPRIDSVALVRVSGPETATTLPAADLGGVTLVGPRVTGVHSVPVPLTWAPDDGDVGLQHMQLQITWRDARRLDLTNVDPIADLWIDVAPR